MSLIIAHSAPAHRTAGDPGRRGHCCRCASALQQSATARLQGAPASAPQAPPSPRTEHRPLERWAVRCASEQFSALRSAVQCTQPSSANCANVILGMPNTAWLQIRQGSGS